MAKEQIIEQAGEYKQRAFKIFRGVGSTTLSKAAEGFSTASVKLGESAAQLEPTSSRKKIMKYGAIALGGGALIATALRARTTGEASFDDSRISDYTPYQEATPRTRSEADTDAPTRPIFGGGEPPLTE